MWAFLRRTSLEQVLEAAGPVPFNGEDRGGSGLARDINTMGYWVFQEKSSSKELSSVNLSLCTWESSRGRRLSPDVLRKHSGEGAK